MATPEYCTEDTGATVSTDPVEPPFDDRAGKALLCQRLRRTLTVDGTPTSAKTEKYKLVFDKQ